MKKTVLYLALFLVTSSLLAQQGINYKAVISDNGVVLQSQTVQVQFSVLKDGVNLEYQEIQSTTTDANGIIILNIGEGTVLNGLFNNIDWRNEQFLKVEIDTGGGYVDFGTTAFKSVPHAKSADKLLPTDRIVIGDESMNHGERLYIEVPVVGSSELVDLIVDAPVSNDDIINLKFGAVPPSGTAQFIEASVGSTVMFKVNHTGAVYAAGGMDTNNDINIIGGNLNAYNNATISGDLDVTGNVTSDLEMGDNEIHGAGTGNADMKAFRYGKFGTYDGGVILGGGSGGFTVSGSNGWYHLTYDTYGFNTTIVATFLGLSLSDTLTILHTYTTYVGETMEVYFETYNSSGNIVDIGGTINFVIYKN